MAQPSFTRDGVAQDPQTPSPATSAEATRTASATEATQTAKSKQLRAAAATLDRIAADASYPSPDDGAVIMGSSTFRMIGMEFLWLFIEHGGLQPEHAVLDVGCGGGRMAAALLYHLDGGSYHGFDIHKPSIDWCQQAIAPRNPSFTFAHVDLNNPLYNNAEASAEEFSFPHPPASFDFAIATSLFTHMFSGEVAHYLQEISRVLRPGGVLFCTAFLLTPASLAQMTRTGGFRVSFFDEHRGSLIDDPEKPEGAVGHFAERFDSYVAAAGFFTERKLAGQWSGDRQAPSFQDILVLRKLDAHTPRPTPTTTQKDSAPAGGGRSALRGALGRLRG